MTSVVLEHDWLVGIAGRSFVLLTLTAAAAFACRRRSASVLHGIWAVGLAGCLAIPLVMLLPPGLPLPVLPRAEYSVSTMPAIPASTDGVSTFAPHGDRREATFEPPKTAQPIASTTLSSPIDSRNTTHPTPTTDVNQFQTPLFRTAAILIWGAGIVAILLRRLHQSVSVQRLLHHASDLDSTAWHHELDDASQRLGMSSNVSLKRHSAALSPMVVGLFRPVVLLPDDAASWPHERRNLVLLHELAHVQRRDVLTQMMATLSCAIYWFNPLAWWGASQMKRLREIACDDAVVTHSSVPATYAQTLLDVAKQYRSRPISTAVAMVRSNDVESRIAAILSSTRCRSVLTKGRVRSFAAVTLALALIVGTCQLTSRADDSAKNETKEKTASSTAFEENAESRTMKVRVLDEEGHPLSGVNVFASISEMDGESRVGNGNYTTDQVGIVEVQMPKRIRLMRLWPSKEGYVPLFLNFATGTHDNGRLIPDEYEFRLQKGHRLSGRVIDESGKPISNVNVQVRARVKEPAWGVNPSPIVSTWLAYGDAAAITDVDGYWQITNAPGPLESEDEDYEFDLWVTHPDFTADARWGELQAQQGITTSELRGSDATLTLNRGTKISGQVTGPEGKPITNGWVVWHDEPYFTQGDWETTLDDQGRFSTPPLGAGEHPITVIAPGYAAQRRVVRAKPGMESLHFELKAGNRIVIHFVDTDGAPISHAGVYLGVMSSADTWNNTNALHNQTGSNVPDYGVPRRANDQGVYIWDWAPKDAVKYHIGAKGFAGKTLSLVPKSEPHVVTLSPQRVVTGVVTDASTGRQVDRFQVMPVIVFSPDHLSTPIMDKLDCSNGHYELPLRGSADPEDHYRVRIEADGYRSIVTEELFGPLDGKVTLDVSLQPAPARTGRVVNADGQPVEYARVLQASPTEVPNTSNGEPDTYGTRPILTDANGEFHFRATTEQVLIRAYHDQGFAEKTMQPEVESIGEMKLRPWSTVSGLLIQDGEPVAGESIYFSPLVKRGLTEARYQDSYYATTDTDGAFQLNRLPPIAGTVRAHLGPWRDSPLTSSEAVPLQLSPGEHREIVLGGDGATVTGRVAATGRNNDDLSKKWSLNYLVSRDRGVDYPVEASPLSIDPSGRLQLASLRHSDFHSWVDSRLSYFVKLPSDGQLVIHGVEPGEYDLVIQLYEQPAGCLVETIGARIVTVTVTAEQAVRGQIDIGEIEVQCRVGPRVGSDMRAFKFTDASGQVRHVDDLNGRYILLHAWATWCTPCIQSMPILKASVERYADAPLTVVGLNVDNDEAQAKAMANAQGMDWAQNYLGLDSDLMRQLAISTVPAYYLIGPDGELVGSANQWEQIDKLLSTELSENSDRDSATSSPLPGQPGNVVFFPVQKS